MTVSEEARTKAVEEAAEEYRASTGWDMAEGHDIAEAFIAGARWRPAGEAATLDPEPWIDRNGNRWVRQRDNASDIRAWLEPRPGYVQDRAAYEGDQATVKEPDELTSSGEHRMVVMYGEMEVCDTCLNSLGYNIRWDQAPCQKVSEREALRERLEKKLRSISFRVTERKRFGTAVIPVESSAVDLWKALDAVLAVLEGEK